ncbi:MAG TPA: 2-octaprenyl-3-methyl-6-methoxy-1,4-benzoquinol hydroxylase [Pseudohongiella sp.]|nr:2-octaprenyl-3-methyl-6-methoxy-1,4-benzoquinol hydroxylase [Pseudohongiella sp.]MAO41438.1 2-octaprenyl-3-methyl-6-methoxy-1,4-benzoquinol hydroxylase [Pseudohongiella sp.]HBX36482.1 2-octaprenyl-3-methyl-6-methoxy-1,4-benzoquinol hydroxylase [Pseudohongiella sp.]|tara:strand:+ start:3069 stop:4316 length:1248 start_codon:yes stop_codon:yes gene_type:complete
MSQQTHSHIQHETEIAVVGAGLVGATMALALADAGINVLLLDAAPVTAGETETQPESYDPRVSAITHASQRLFQQLQVWPAIEAQRSCAYTHMHVREADGTGQIDFDARDVHTDSLGHIVENRIMLSALQQRMAEYPNLQVLAPVTVTACQQVAHSGTAQKAELTLNNGDTVQAGLVIAADGAGSPLRSMAGIATREWDYEHQAIVTTICTEQAHHNTARQIFMDEGVLAFLPLADQAAPQSPQRYCSIVWSVIPSMVESLMSMDDAAFCQALSNASQHWLGSVQHTDKRFSFPLRQRHARRYHQGPLVLIGDAAHSIHPLAGQGANLGLADVQVLAEELVRARHSGRSPADPIVLSRYQRRRQPNNLSMMVTMEAFKRLYAEQPLPVRWLRNTGMDAVDRLPVLKQFLIRQALG